MSIFEPSDRTLQVTLLLFPQSSMMTLASALDTMRAANRISGRQLFDWEVVTPDGLPAPLTCGLVIAADAALSDRLQGDALFVIAGFDHQQHLDRKTVRSIQCLHHRFALLGGIEAGSWVLARCGLLQGRRATTHWEDLEDFALEFPEVRLSADRFIIDGDIFTTGGASPTFDFMLQLIRRRYGYPLSLEVASVFIYDDVHHASDTQPLVSLGLLANQEPRVAMAIQLMEQHIDAPLRVAQIAERLSLSVRTLENLFRNTLDVSPGLYYRRLRLQTARRLVVDTRLPLREIALRTGFNSLPAFSRLFKDYYQISAARYRQQAHTHKG